MNVIRWSLFVVFLTPVLVAAALAAPPNPPSSNPKSPDIILITLDTTRADRMGFLGSTRGLTPNLDALAKQSAVFTRAYSQVPLTPPSHAAILSGTYPQFNHVTGFELALPQDVPYAPAILRAQGYRTAAFLGSIVLKPEQPYAPGFDRGFDFYDADFNDEGPGQDRYHTVRRRGNEVVAHALAWLDKHPKGPFFLWVHLYDAHEPYDPPEPYKTQYASQPYDGGIAYADAAVGKFLHELRARGLYDGSVIAVMADHGESLGAHGEDTHGIFLYDETIQVPLVIKLPHGDTTRRIEERVELVDVLPTLLEAVGVKSPAEVQGQSLLGLMKMEAGTAEGDIAAQAWRNRGAYAQSDYARRIFGWSALQSLRTGKYLYVQAPRRELYDQTSDPKAEHNLAQASPGTADTLASQLQTFEQKTTSNTEAPRTEIDPAAQEKLAALGYMAATNVSQGNTSEQRQDPKDKIEIANMAHRAESLHMDAHFEESIALLQEAIARDPKLPLYDKLGLWLVQENEYQKAVPVLRKAVQMDPNSFMDRLQLAKALIGSENFEEAIPELQFVIARAPTMVEAHSYLELAYARTNRPLDAIAECKTVLHYDPEDYGSLLILGQSLARTGDPHAGIATLKKAMSLQPKDPTPHMWLAEIYDQLGQKADADRERAQAKRLQANFKHP